MLKIRLQRTGRTNEQQFRLVLTEKTSAAKKKAIEILGHYDPKNKTKSFKKERIEHWLKMGAQPSDTAFNLLHSENIVEGQKRGKKKISKRKRQEEVKKQAEAKEADKKAKEEVAAKTAEPKAEEVKEEAPAEVPAQEEPKAEAPKEEEKTEEAPKAEAEETEAK